MKGERMMSIMLRWIQTGMDGRDRIKTKSRMKDESTAR
jgi:hypothetical protein